MKNLFYLLLAVTIFTCSDDEGNPCVYEPTLTTEAVTDITETSATLNGTIDVYSQNCDTVENILQGFVYSTSSEPTIDDNIVNLDGTSISEVITGLEPNTTYYVRVFLVRPLIGIFYGNEVSFVTSDNNDCDVVYLDNNGVTIKAYPCAEIGDVGIVNGVEYIVVDREMILAIVGYNSGGGTINEDLTKMCTTRITDMSNMFYNCNAPDFNQAIGNWDVSNVTNMNRMFNAECGLYSFNQDLSNWDVSSVTDMSGMFSYSYTFNQDISSWDVSSVTDMSYMFSYSNSFNQDISSWDVSSVTDMSSMFAGVATFNQDLSNWDVSSVTDMSYMFYNSQFDDQPIGNWNTSNVTDMSYMFSNSQFDQPIANWNTSNVTDMSYMFYNANSFNQDIGNWDVSNVNSMRGMFYGGIPFSRDIGNWDVSSVTDMSYMFFGNGELNAPIGNWDVSSVTNMQSMFENNNEINQDLSSWNVVNTNLCTNFNNNTPQWTLPQPNFTNCNP